VEVGNWHFFKTGNHIFNGSCKTRNVTPTRIPFQYIIDLISSILNCIPAHPDCMLKKNQGRRRVYNTHRVSDLEEALQTVDV